MILDWIADFLCHRSQRVVLERVYSDSRDLVSGVPQGSVLGPTLFLLFLNDLGCPDNDTLLLKFADDLRLNTEIAYPSDCTRLSSVIDHVTQWSRVWQLPLSASKCNVLHVGRENPRHIYQLNGTALQSVQTVRDLGVSVSSSLKFSDHCANIVISATRRSAFVTRCFRLASPLVRAWAFKTYVRPLLEYASPTWSPHLLGDVDLLESVQRRYTKSIKEYCNLSYGQRLLKLNLPSLELRRLRSDLHLAFVLIRGFSPLPCPFFSFHTDNRTRGHPFKCTVDTFRTDCRKFFFANRVVPIWNSLPAEVVNLPSVTAFKKALLSINLTRFLLRPEHAATP